MYTSYEESDDSLLILLMYKTPAGRTLRKKWTNDWRVIPNLESWLHFFKTNERNLKNELFYDIDYHQAGHIFERVKLLYPSDKSVIMAKQQIFGDNMLTHYKVFKETLSFGLKPPSNVKNKFSELWAVLPN